VGVMSGEHLERSHLQGSQLSVTQEDMGPRYHMQVDSILLEDKKYSSREDCNVPFLGHYYITECYSYQSS
jgi:hypothetical protein